MLLISLNIILRLFNIDIVCHPRQDRPTSKTKHKYSVMYLFHLIELLFRNEHTDVRKIMFI